MRRLTLAGGVLVLLLGSSGCGPGADAFVGSYVGQVDATSATCTGSASYSGSKTSETWVVTRSTANSDAITVTTQGVCPIIQADVSGSQATAAKQTCSSASNLSYELTQGSFTLSGKVLTGSLTIAASTSILGIAGHCDIPVVATMTKQ